MTRRLLLVFASIVVLFAGLPLAGVSARASGPSYDQLVYQPSIPIAAPGSLSAGQTVTGFYVQARQNGSGVANAIIDLTFQTLFTQNNQAGGSATAGPSCGSGLNATVTLSSTAVACQADSSGKVTLTYTAPNPYPSPKVGRDVITASDPNDVAPSNNDFYVFSPVMSYGFSPNPIAAAGSLSAGQTVSITVTAYDGPNATGNPVPGVYMDLSLTSTASTSGSATATDIDPTTQQPRGPRCLPSSPAGACASNSPEIFLTNSNGQVSITYKAANPLPNPPAGVDTITAQDHPTFTVENTDSYSYVGPGPYTPVTPSRICDTRYTSYPGCSGGALGAGSTKNVQITGQGGIPTSGVSAVVMNVTAIGPTANTYLTVYPTGASARPLVSNLDPQAGQTIANLVEVAIGSGGQVSIYNFQGSVNVAVDVEGYYSTTNASPPAGEFVPISPTRICDTRYASQPACASGVIGPGQSRVIQIAGEGGLPSSGVAAVVFNLTAVGTTANTYLTAYADGATRPVVSNVDLPARSTLPNRVAVEVGGDGAIDIYNFSGDTNIIVDVNGWYKNANAGSSPTGYLFSPVVPARACDTRTGSGCTGAKIGTGATLNVDMAGGAGIPATTASSPPQALVLNVTAVNATASSYFTVYPGPSGSSRPTASDLDFPANMTIPNLVVVEIGTDGTINIYNFAGTTDCLVDVFGYFS